MTFDQEKRKELSDSVPKTVFDTNFNARYLAFTALGEDNAMIYRDWYSGMSQIHTPRKDDNSLQFVLETSNLTGTFTTANFGQPFNDTTFERAITSSVYINVPDMGEDSKVIIDFEYDIEGTGIQESIKISIEIQENEEYGRPEMQEEKDKQLMETCGETEKEKELLISQKTIRREFPAKRYNFK